MCVYVTYDAQVAEKSLLQTLFELHVVKWCHLDVSPGNVMLQSHSDHPWDTLRLVDFGFAKQFEAGTFCHGQKCLFIKVTFVHVSQLLSRQLLVFHCFQCAAIAKLVAASSVPEILKGMIGCLSFDALMSTHICMTQHT